MIEVEKKEVFWLQVDYEICKNYLQVSEIVNL